MHGKTTQTLLSGVKTNHDDALTPGVEVFRAAKHAQHIQAMANYGYIYELTRGLRSHSGTNNEIKGTVHRTEVN